MIRVEGIGTGFPLVRNEDARKGRRTGEGFAEILEAEQKKLSDILDQDAHRSTTSTRILSASPIIPHQKGEDKMIIQDAYDAWLEHEAELEAEEHRKAREEAEAEYYEALGDEERAMED